LNVEHEGDLTPGLENEPNPVEPNRTTVRRDIAASDDPQDAGVVSVVQAHDLPAYQRTAEMIDSSDQRPITSWRAQAADVLAGDTATVETYYYVLRRDEWRGRWRGQRLELTRRLPSGRITVRISEMIEMIRAASTAVQKPSTRNP